MQGSEINHVSIIRVLAGCLLYLQMTSVTRKFTPTNDQIKKENKNSLFPPYHASRTSLIKFPMNTDIIEWYHPDLTIVLFVTSQHEDLFLWSHYFFLPSSWWRENFFLSKSKSSVGIYVVPHPSGLSF